MRTKVPPGIQDHHSFHPDWQLLSRIEKAILDAFGGHERMADFMAGMLRKSIDDVVDTAGSGRKFIEELEKTEKTYLGTKVEILMRHRMGVPKGHVLDLLVDGEEVDIKFTVKGNWMVPPEAFGRILLLVAADEDKGLFWMGLIKADESYLTAGQNRDVKKTISASGFAHIRWLLNGRDYEPNFWRNIPQNVIDAAFDPDKRGTERMMRLFSMLPRHPIPRRVVEEVTQQLDFTRRVRANGGARDIMGQQFVILGDHMGQDAVRNLGLPPLAKGAYIAIDIRDAKERAIIEQSSQTRNVKAWLASRPSPKGPIVAIRRRDVPLEFTYDVDEAFDAEVVREGRSP